MLRSAAGDQDVGANHSRRSLRQPGTGCQLKAMHLVNLDRRRWSCPDVDDGSVHVHHIELRMNANTPNDAVQGLLHRGRPDVWSHLLHVDTDECLAGPAYRLRTFVIAEYD